MAQKCGSRKFPYLLLPETKWELQIKGKGIFKAKVLGKYKPEISRRGLVKVKTFSEMKIMDSLKKNVVMCVVANNKDYISI